MKQMVYDTLEKMGIEYKVVNHPLAMTTLEADKFIEGMEVIRSKTMFVSDKKKKRFYLLILDDEKRLDLKKIGDILGESRLRLGSEDNLMEKMSLQFGSVSLFGLLNNKEKDIKICIDKELLDEKIITFHPNENDATVFITMDDMFKFLDNLNFSYELIEM